MGTSCVRQPDPGVESERVGDTPREVAAGLLACDSANDLTDDPAETDWVIGEPVTRRESRALRLDCLNYGLPIEDIGSRQVAIKRVQTCPMR